MIPKSTHNPQAWSFHRKMLPVYPCFSSSPQGNEKGAPGAPEVRPRGFCSLQPRGKQGFGSQHSRAVNGSKECIHPQGGGTRCTQSVIQDCAVRMEESLWVGTNLPVGCQGLRTMWAVEPVGMPWGAL